MRAAWLLLGFAAACDPGSSPQPPEGVSTLVETQQPPEPTSQPVSGDLYEATAPKILADGSELYGAALDDAQSLVSLADLLSEPRKYEGKMVKTEGKISRVCKAMGCWVEISDDFHTIFFYKIF